MLTPLRFDCTLTFSQSGLGCLGADVCNKIIIVNHFSWSTRCTFFRTARHSNFRRHVASCFRLPKKHKELARNLKWHACELGIRINFAFYGGDILFKTCRDDVGKEQRDLQEMRHAALHWFPTTRDSSLEPALAMHQDVFENTIGMPSRGSRYRRISQKMTQN